MSTPPTAHALPDHITEHVALDVGPIGLPVTVVGPGDRGRGGIGARVLDRHAGGTAGQLGTHRRLEVGEREVLLHLAAAGRRQPGRADEFFQLAGCRERERAFRAGRWRWQQPADRGQDRAALAALGIAPGEHGDRAAGPGHAFQLAQRRGRVGRVLDRVERRHRAERAVTVGQRLEVAPAQVGAGDAFGRYLQQRRGGVETGDRRAPLGGDLQRQAGAAAGVEQLGGPVDADGVEHRLVERRAVRLVQL
jgi:hypothetical protein